MQDNRDEINQLLAIDPCDLNEEGASEIRYTLLTAAKKIDLQLSSRKRTFINGDPMTDMQYRTWRTRAIAAKNHIEDKYRRVKDRLKETRREGNTWRQNQNLNRLGANGNLE